MAQAGVAGSLGAGGFMLSFTLAAGAAAECVAGCAGGTCPRGNERLAPSAVVSRLLSLFHAGWLCHQPGHWFRGTCPVLSFHPHAGWLGFAVRGQRPFATQAPGRHNDFLADDQGPRSSGPAILT